MHDLATRLSTTLPWSVIPDVPAVQPPGMEGIMTALGWLTWGCTIAALAGFLIAAGGLAFAHLSGRAVPHFKGLAYAIGAAILVAGASNILRTFA